MRTGKPMLVAVLVSLSVGAAVAAAQSLGDVARQFRQQQGKETRKAVKVYTNDNLPPPAPWEEVAPAVDTTKATPKPEAESKPGGPVTQPAEPAAEKSDDKKRTQEYWQEKFTTARREVASAESAQRLAQDELSLLQIQQAREIDPDVQSQVATKIQAKQAELTAIQAQLDAAQKVLDDLQKEFDASGAPAEWSQTEKPAADNETPSP